MRWKEWSGYFAVCSYDIGHEREYHSFRHAAGMIDVTPLFKYDIRGKDACSFLCRIMARNIAKLKHKQVTYLCWCDDEGKVVDDGTVSHLDENYYRVTSADPSLHWFLRHTRGFDVTIEDVSDKLTAVAVQGPNARKVLNAVSDANMDALKFFHLTHARLDGGIEAIISRTGYTGDLGYEIWVDNADALNMWDAVMDAGRVHGLEAAALDAMDVTRVEAGFIMNGVDYFSSLHSLIDSRKASPYELSLGWTVQLKRDPFIGQAALRKEKKAGPKRLFVGLEVDWVELERLFAKHGLPPEIPAGAWRSPVPVYDMGERLLVRPPSGAWSPLLKKNLALATIGARHGQIGNRVKFEITVEYERKTVSAAVVSKPFYDPEWKKA